MEVRSGQLAVPRGLIQTADAATVLVGVDDLTTGNLNAPTIMIGEKGADHVRGHALLPATNVPVYAASNWQTAQP